MVLVHYIYIYIYVESKFVNSLGARSLGLLTAEVHDWNRRTVKTRRQQRPLVSMFLRQAKAAPLNKAEIGFLHGMHKEKETNIGSFGYK